MTSHSSNTDVFVLEDLCQQRLNARYLVAALRREGFRVQLIHYGIDTHPDEIVAQARQNRPGLIILSILFAHLLAENLDLATRLRSETPDVHLSLAGPLPTLAYADLLATCPALDSILCGEAESIVVELASRLQAGTNWWATAGLAYRDPVPTKNPRPPVQLDLDSLAWPARDFGIQSYEDVRFVTVEASRGCYHRCSFCLPCTCFRQIDPARAYRQRSIGNFMQEIEELVDVCGVRLFLFDDEQFLPPGRLRQKRVLELCKMLEKSHLKIAFTMKCRPDDVERDVLEQLQSAGLIRVYVGIESGCQESLDLFNKDVTPQQNVQALALLHQMDVLADFRLLLFHPWSTLETISTELDFLERLLPLTNTPFTFHEVECYLGTPMAQMLAREGRGQTHLGNVQYTLMESGGEFVRRLGRVVFGSRNAQGSVVSRITSTWYDVLLQKRFGEYGVACIRAQTLSEIVRYLNSGSLYIWREVLEFAPDHRPASAEEINRRATAWTTQVARLDLKINQRLENLAELFPRNNATDLT